MTTLTAGVVRGHAAVLCQGGLAARIGQVLGQAQRDLGEDLQRLRPWQHRKAQLEGHGHRVVHERRLATGLVQRVVARQLARLLLRQPGPRP